MMQEKKPDYIPAFMTIVNINDINIISASGGDSGNENVLEKDIFENYLGLNII